MLRRLSLRDFVIFSSLDVEFNGGFSVLTGETGAGKSILLDSMTLALGGRGDGGKADDHQHQDGQNQEETLHCF